MRHRNRIPVALGALAAAVSSSAVELTRVGDSWHVSNACYVATYDLTNGGMLRRLGYGGDSRNVYGTFEVTTDGQKEVFNGRPHDAGLTTGSRGAKAFKSEVLVETVESVVLRFSWALPDGGRVSETIFSDDTPLVRHLVDVDWKRSICSVTARLQTLEMKGMKSVFLPENRWFSGVYMQGQRSALPRWKYATDGTFGFGFVADEDVPWDHFDFQARARAPKSWGDQVMMTLVRNDLSGVPVPGRTQVRYSTVYTPDAKRAFSIASQELKSAPAVQLCDIVPDRVFSERGHRNGLTTTLVNNTKEKQSVKAVVELSTGLDTVTKVSEETLTLEPGEMRVYRKDWSYPDGVEWGVASRISVLAADGRLLDSRSDVVSVSDRGFAAAGCGIINTKMAAQEGMADAWADVMRRTYIGMFEYYIWSPSCWDPDRKAGLAPVADEWDPVSEHSSTRPHVTKKYLKRLVEASHERGIHVYSWITGLVNYRMAVAHPDKFQYCRNGQLQIYSGKVHGKDRFAVAKIAPYTVEDSADWGDQMADSVDMFGWDGCRWDWGFLPCAPNDPLYMNELGLDPEKFVWYDWKGRRSTDLYPDPDTTGAECLKAWRAAVNRRHPRFVYTTNLHATKEAFENTPKYLAEATRDGMALLEYLIGFTRDVKTYQAFGSRLAADSMRCRRNGSHTEVGHVSAFQEWSVGGQMARYVCGAAGSKWWGNPSDYRYWTSKHRSLPFAIRFSEYFFGLDFVRHEAEDAVKAVKVLNGNGLFWKEFVYSRPKDGGRELICHVINVKPETICLQKQADVTPVTDLRVEVRPCAREKVVEAWGLVPGDEPKAIRLKLDGTVATLPRLEEAAVVLFRLSKKEAVP